jgi:hypothetical protein
VRDWVGFAAERLRERLGEFCRGMCYDKRERKSFFFFFFFNIIDASDCYNGALYIRLYYSILMFRESYRESAMGPFL